MGFWRRQYRLGLNGVGFKQQASIYLTHLRSGSSNLPDPFLPGEVSAHIILIGGDDDL